MRTMLDQLLSTYAPGGLQWAKLADEWAGAMDRAKDGYDFSLAELGYNHAREELLSVLMSLEKSAWTWEGMGLLPVETVLQQRDPTLYGLFRKIWTADASMRGRAAFRCAIEAYMFVFPERPPLKALIFGLDRLYRQVSSSGTISVSRGNELLEPILATLRNEDFWIPQGVSSLDGFLTAMSESVPSAIEVDARTVLSDHGWSWESVRDDLNDSNPNLLRKMIGFRRDLTAALMKKAVETVAPDALRRYGSRFQWIVYEAPGSDRPTSDHDVSARGSCAAYVVQTFNTLFRGWVVGKFDVSGNPRTDFVGLAPPCELESAFVFDVNVYTNDYHWNAGRRYLLPDVPDPDFWPTNPTNLQDAEKAQDQFALLKIRRYIHDDDQWTLLRNSMLEQLSGDDRTAAAAQFDAVNTLCPTLNAEVAARLAVVKARTEFSPWVDKFARSMQVRAENELYQEQLNRVEDLRYNNGAPINDKIRADLAAALGKAGFFAQEAYHTAGAVRDIVANVQLRRGLVLRDIDLLCSMNEQAGDIFKEIGHLGVGVDPSTNIVFAVKVSKYMVRLGNAALSLNARMADLWIDQHLKTVRVARRSIWPINNTNFETPMGFEELLDLPTELNQTVQTLIDLRALCQLWLRSTVRLLEIKDHPEDFTDAEKQQRLKETPWKQGSIDLGKFLVGLTALLNAHYRGNTRMGAIQGLLHVLLAEVMKMAKQPAAS
jgi:hypothetical protein